MGRSKVRGQHRPVKTVPPPEAQTGIEPIFLPLQRVVHNHSARKLLNITIGLGAVFHEVKEAELAWLNGPNTRLGTTPLRAILDGRLDEVLGQVNEARGLR